MADHDPFGQAGGAAGVGKGDEVALGVDLHVLGLRRRVLGHLPDVLEGPYVLEAGEVLAQVLDGGLEEAHGEDGGGAAVLELVEDLALLVEGVEGRDDAAGVGDALEDDDILGHVGREDSYAIALLDALILEEAAEAAAGLPHV